MAQLGIAWLLSSLYFFVSRMGWPFSPKRSAPWRPRPIGILNWWCIPNLSVVSESDKGVGDARNRAVRRCRGEIVGSIDADNMLPPDALRCAVETFRQHPECAAIYGSVNVIDQEGNFLSCFQPSAFDPFRLMQCELVPPLASSFFSKQVCGAELHFNPDLENCEDFDLWLRLSHLPIVRSDAVLNATRLSPKSMSQNTDRYEIFCQNKIRALESYLRRYHQDNLIRSVYRFSVAGIYLWAAESISGIEGEGPRFTDFCRRAAELDATSRRLENLQRKVEYGRIQAEYQHVHAEYERVHAEYERVQAEYNRLHAEFHSVQNNFQVARHEGAQLRFQLAAIENSRGWRMVLKYRSLRDRVKRLFKAPDPDKQASERSH